MREIRESQKLCQGLQNLKGVPMASIHHPDKLSWLYADNYRTYNIDIARRLNSIHAAILLAELASRYRYHRDRDELTSDSKHGDGWFYYTQEDLEDRTLLTRKNQDTCIEILQGFGLIEKKSIGIPAKRHFRINIERINEFFIDPSEQSRLSETDKQGCLKKTNSAVRFGQPAPYIYKPKEEPKNNNTPLPPKGEAAEAASVREKENLQSFGKFVKLGDKEHSSLKEAFGEAMVKQIIEEMNDYLSASGKKPYKDYAAAIRQWIRKRKSQPQAQSFANNRYPDRRQRNADGSIAENPYAGVF